MHDLARDHPQALGPLLNENPRPEDLHKWLAACGQYYAKVGKALTVLVDGLDHVWRERRSLLELTRLLEYLLPPPEGVVLVFASQPVDDDQLPPILLRHAPRDGWVELPQLDQPAVEQWVRKHASDFPSQAEQLQSDRAHWPPGGCTVSQRPRPSLALALHVEGDPGAQPGLHRRGHCCPAGMSPRGHYCVLPRTLARHP